MSEKEPSIIRKLIIYGVILHVLNYKMENIGWNGNWFEKSKQIMSLPWSLI